MLTNIIINMNINHNNLNNNNNHNDDDDNHNDNQNNSDSASDSDSASASDNNLNDNDNDNNNLHLSNLIYNTNNYQSNIIINLFRRSSKLYLVDHRENEFQIEIDILGSKKKSKREQYITIFDKNNSNFTCNCMNFICRSKQHNSVCKHITFIVCKVLGIYDYKFFETKKLNKQYQKKLLKTINSSIWYDNNISIKYINYEFKQNVVRQLNINDKCPICCDYFNNIEIECDTTNSKEIISCPECFNFIHKDCMDIWIKISNNCVYCRSYKWENYVKDILSI